MPSCVHHSQIFVTTRKQKKMTLFLLLCLFSSISALTLIPIDTQHPKSAHLNVIPVDTQMFFESEVKPPHFDAVRLIPTDTQTFFTGQTQPTHVPGYGATIDYPKSSDLTLIPVNTQTFFNSDPKLPHAKTISVTLKHPKPSAFTALHIDTQTFFNHNPMSPILDSTVHHPKSSDINVTPVDSQTFFTSEPKPPRHGATVPPTKSTNHNPIQLDNNTFFRSTEPKYKDSASYCSVYLKKESFNKGSIVCPLFASPSPTQESSIRSICQDQSQENEFKFCSSSYQDISKKVTDRLGKNKLVSSTRLQINISTIAGIKNIAAYGQAVICHKAQYVGFYCHRLGKSSVFALSLSDLNGDHLKYGNMFAVCHDETRSWNRNRPVFKILKTKPGDAICHLLPPYDLVWVALR